MNRMDDIGKSMMVKSNTQEVFLTHEHPNFGKGKHRVNPDAVNHEFRRKLWEG